MVKKMRERIEEKLEKLEKIRKIKGKNQQEFSDELGVSRTTYNMWINGQKIPDYDSLDIINEYLEG